MRARRPRHAGDGPSPPPGTGPGLLLALLALLAAPVALGAQTPALRIEGGGTVETVAPVEGPGYAALPGDVLALLGWEVREGKRALTAVRGADTLRLEVENPFFRWRGDVFQLAEAPSRRDGGILLPRQLVSDWLPAALGGAYRYDADGATLRMSGGRPVVPAAGAGPAGGGEGEPAARTLDGRDSRLVVIDPGHGGRDPGTVGRRGTKEKDVALAVGRALAEELGRDSTLEVRLTRDEDELVPLWRRGELATDLKDGRPAIFISLHANAVASRRATRGFETYFLSEARTDHERRVAAIENSAAEYDDRRDVPVAGGSELTFILNELRNLDHAHWSALLAEKVQEELDPVHPGPNRGVKQAPLAVVTNALMPAVLVELGFLSNRAEESLLVQRSFQREAAGALARAVRAFFRRYPPGTGVTADAR